MTAACGFRPMYGNGGAGGDVVTEFAEVKVAVIEDRKGQELRNKLQDLLTPRGAPATPQYLLEVELKEVITEVAVERTGLATRANLRLDATYGLVDNRSGAVVMRDISSATSSYNLSDMSQFSTLTAQNDARSRTLDRIARVIRTRLGAFFNEQRSSAPAPAR